MKYFGRKISLIVSERDTGEGIDLSGLRITFEVRKGDTSSPNEAYITVYNLNKETRNRIRTGRQDVILSAGYGDEIGLIFKGTIRNFWIGGQWGIESEITPTDNMLTIVCADGDWALKHAYVVATLSKNSSISEQINLCKDALNKCGIDTSNVNAIANSVNKLPRAKCIFGPAQDILTSIADGIDSSWSIQDGELEIHKKNDELNGLVLDISSDSGLVGAPKLGNKMIEFDTLLDNRIRIGTNVIVHDVNDSDITARMLTVIHKGDTHGQEWLTSCKAIITDVSSRSVL